MAAQGHLPLLDRIMLPVAPGIVLERALNRAKLVALGYDAASPGARRGSNGGQAKNAAAPSLTDGDGASPQRSLARMEVL